MEELELKKGFDMTRLCDWFCYVLAIGVPWVIGMLWLADAVLGALQKTA